MKQQKSNKGKRSDGYHKRAVNYVSDTLLNDAGFPCDHPDIVKWMEGNKTLTAWCNENCGRTKSCVCWRAYLRAKANFGLPRVKDE